MQIALFAYNLGNPIWPWKSDLALEIRFGPGNPPKEPISAAHGVNHCTEMSM